MPYGRRINTRRRTTASRRKPTAVRRTMVRKTPMYRSRALASSGFPERKIVKLRYAQSLVMPSLGSPLGSHHFRTNSLFDPDYSGAGHQPYGFDQWAAVYGKYEVLSSTITVRFVPAQGTQTAICGIDTVDAVDTSVILDTIRERPGAYSKLCVPQQPVMIRRKWTFRKDSVNHAGFENTAAVTADPVDSDYFRVWVSSVDGATNLTAYSLVGLVQITYVCKFWERAILTGS